MNHKTIWDAIESFAAKHKLTCSALARTGGLDATTFNKSKRWSNAGQERFPSMGSVAKFLRATNSCFMEFAEHIKQAEEKNEKVKSKE